MNTKEPKDYPMGRTDQVFYVIKWACIWAFGGLWMAAAIKFGILWWEAMK